MPNGKIGDHPYTDIMIHDREIYSSQARALVREIASLGDDQIRRELADMLMRDFNEFANPDVSKLERVLSSIRDRLLAEARERGYEV
jgi:hypothetical protein